MHKGGVARFALMTIILIIVGFYMSLSMITRLTEMGDESRIAEDVDVIRSYAESLSLDLLDSSLDTSWKKNNILYISDETVIPKIGNLFRNNILSTFSVSGKKAQELGYRNIKVHVTHFKVGRGAYTENPDGTFTQRVPKGPGDRDDDRPFIQGVMEVEFIPMTKADKEFTTAGRTRNMRQKVKWLVYANPVPEDYVNTVGELDDRNRW